MFHQMAPQRIARLPVTDPVGHPWRVLSADGSTRVCEPASGDGPLRAVAGLEVLAAVTSTPTKRNIAMPAAEPELSALSDSDPEATPGEVFQWRRTISSPNLGAVVVVDSSGDRQPSRPAPRAAAEGPPDQDLQISPSPAQAPRSCREVDSQLARIIDLLPKLPGNARVVVLAMIEAAKDNP